MVPLLPFFDDYNVPHYPFPPFFPLALDLYNHLRHPRSTQRLTSHKRLALERRQSVAETGERQEDAGNNERSGAIDVGQKDDGGHDAVGGGAHVVC